ncbi:hypothetical protein RCL1_008440 [Eukaryota sp. TZLM3-RCL]
MKDFSPSLRLIQEAQTSSRAEQWALCKSIGGVIEYLSADQLVLELLRNITERTFTDNDDFSHSSFSGDISSKLALLVEKNLLTTSFDGVLFHDPLVRRAACSFFSDFEISACKSVSKCSEIGQ